MAFLKRSIFYFLLSFGVSCSLINATHSLGTIGPASPVLDRKAQILDDMKSLGVLREGYSEWYVAPGGSKTGRGTADSPAEIESALSGALSDLRPGDVIWLRDGTYKVSLTSTIHGSRGLPIHLRQYPGERAVLDKGTNSRGDGALDVRGDFVWFWDFEVANSSPDRRRLDADGDMNPTRGSGINIYAADTKYINLIVRDNGHGFGLWNEEGSTEIYGCIIFNNGNNKKEHGIYGHNKTGSHLIANNVIFNNAGYGLHLYANSEKSSVSGFQVVGNTIFNNGSLMLEDQVADQILVGGVKGVPAARIELRSNYIFNELDAPTSKNRGIRLGYEDTANKDVKLIDNYIVSKIPLRVLWWESVEARGNTIYSNGKNIEFTEPAINGKREYSWDTNTYLSDAKGEPQFLLNKGKLAFASWRADKGFDRSSKLAAARENAVFVMANKYDPTRAVVTIYNWTRKPKAEIDIGTFLAKGDRFEIRDAQNIFGDPSTVGEYDGKPLILNLTGGAATPPVGSVEKVPGHSGTEFGVFLIKKTGR
jgi:hypothetical protein